MIIISTSSRGAKRQSDPALQRAMWIGWIAARAKLARNDEASGILL